MDEDEEEEEGVSRIVEEPDNFTSSEYGDEREGSSIGERPTLTVNASQISSASSVTLASEPTPTATGPSTAVKRRTQLPAPTSGDEISLFTVLKRNVGKVHRVVCADEIIY